MPIGTLRAGGAGRLQPEQLSMAVKQGLRRGLVTAGQLKEEAERRHKQNAIAGILSTRDTRVMYTRAAAFRQALEQRLKDDTASTHCTSAPTRMLPRLLHSLA